MYGPAGVPFIGLATVNHNELIDYWLSMREKTLSRINVGGGQLKLKALYGVVEEGNMGRIQRVTSNMFEYLKLLGKGVAGTVFLVRSRYTGQYFALKQIEKKYISDYKKFEQILREKKILT